MTESREYMLKFFEDPNHLPDVLKYAFKELAEVLVEHLPRNPERTVALRKLLEAQDSAERAHCAE